MCGIAGVVRLGPGDGPPRELLLSMVAQLRHRGPDGFGLYRDSWAGLAHARLAIVDLTTGDQPLSDPDGTWWIVFNGEIFNHRALRTELRSRGHRFATSSDTEVIVNAYREWGTDCFARFNGQWAFALWSPSTQELVLSRDPSGICPLFVHEGGGRVRFASEVKALFADPDVSRTFDVDGIQQTFMYWASQAPVTPFSGIEELRPGTYRIYRAGKVEDGVHWAPTYPPTITATPSDLRAATEELAERLQIASRLRITSADVPVGAYLSGGLDSSLTAMLGSDASAGRLETFSLGFEDDGFDERPFQRLVATRLGSRHHEITVSRADIAEVFPEVIFHSERPVLRTAPAPMFLLSRAVRAAGVKAVLTGEGADEILAGYDIFREARIRAFWARRPESTVRPELFDRIYPYLDGMTGRTKRMAQAFWKIGLEDVGRPGFSHGPRWRGAASLRRFYGREFADAAGAADAPGPLDHLPDAFGSWSPLSQAQYLEFTTLLSPYILSSQGDRQLLGNGVEGRFPFLDPDVMALCNSLPAGFKLRSLDEKHLLKQVALDHVPAEILARKKQPYRAPDAVCFLGDERPAYVAEMMRTSTLEAAGVFDPTAVRALVRKLEAQRAEGRGTPSNADNMAFVGILSTQLVHHQFIVGPRAPHAADIRLVVDVEPPDMSQDHR